MKTINPMNTTLNFGKDNTVYLTNIDHNQIIDVVSIPCPVWGDKKVLGEQIRKYGVQKGFC